MAKEQYIGFSTVGKKKAPFRLTDIELVKRDLLNTFNTRLGERVMRPTYGTIIFDLLFEPLDDETKALIVEDATRIINNEPRVSLIDLQVHQLGSVLRLDIKLNFTPQNTVDQLYIEYEAKNKAAS